LGRGPSGRKRASDAPAGFAVRVLSTTGNDVPPVERLVVAESRLEIGFVVGRLVGVKAWYSRSPLRAYSLRNGPALFRHGVPTISSRVD
jgi:hypothetical protein